MVASVMKNKDSNGTPEDNWAHGSTSDESKDCNGPQEDDLTHASTSIEKKTAKEAPTTEQKSMSVAKRAKSTQGSEKN